MTYAHNLCEQYNAASHRRDVEWFVRPNGEIAIGYTMQFTQSHTQTLARNAEDERRRFNYRHEQAARDE